MRSSVSATGSNPFADGEYTVTLTQLSEEPEHTIFRPGWHDATARLGALEPRQRDLFSQLLAHIESGWRIGVRDLQLIFERSRGEASPAVGPAADVLSFIDADVVDLYRAVAADAADLVPGRPDWPEEADPGNLDGDATQFVRYLSVLRSAAQSPALQQSDTGPAIERACSALVGWHSELSRLLRPIDEEVIRPILPPDEDSVD